MSRGLVTVVALVCLVGLIAAAPSPADAREGECPDPTVSLLQVDAECEWTLASYQAITSSASEHVWTTAKVCDVGSAALCDVFLSCTRDGVTAWMHQIFMDGIPVGQVCLPDDEEREPPIRVLAIRAFKELSWPSSELVVQPRGGKTLVNLDTNFYTQQPAHQHSSTTSRDGRCRHRPSDRLQVELRRRHVHDHDQPGVAVPQSRRRSRLRAGRRGGRQRGHPVRRRELHGQRRPARIDPVDPLGCGRTPGPRGR
jgi:hypothetical protein